jgi:mRNA interferase MazF
MERKKKIVQAVQRGQVVWVELEGQGSEQRGQRPCIVLQNNVGNRFAPTTIIVPMTTKKPKRVLPTHLAVSEEELGEKLRDSVILCEQIRTIDKKRIKSLGKVLSESIMKQLQEKIFVSLDFS